MQEKEVTTTQFQTLFEYATEGILVTQENGTIVLVNPAAAAMFGYTPPELVGQMIEILIPSAFRGAHTRHRESFRHAPHARSMGLGFELHGQRKDDSVFPVEVSLSPYENEAGRFVMAFIIDTTIRQQLLAQQKQVLVELEKEKELGALKSRFVNIASHEFRTPLTSIASSASLIGSYTDRGDTTNVKKHVERIKKGVNNLQLILNEFLSLGKLEDGRLSVQHEHIHPPELVRDIEEEVQPLLKPGQTLHCQYQGDEPVWIDKNLLRIIVLNLLSNAIKYSPENSPIEVFCKTENGRTELCVRDKGIGISEADQQKLFERFFRASNAGNAPGTGLGLYIVKRYVDMLGGSIRFESRLGEGSAFWVSI